MYQYIHKNFNSIKVQLRPLGDDIQTVQHQGFQFHKGTIKTTNLNFPLQLIKYFNSIKVQLRHVVAE